MTSDAGAGQVALGRVLGWDLLRGLCALAVATYHLLYWQDIASLHTLGSYGVYLFFILSGASLSYNYIGRLNGVREVLGFLATRWLRLAPLYGVLCLVFIAFLRARDGVLLEQWPQRLALNLSFGFGLRDPVIQSLLIGGWSLGIEFVYYLLFPLLLLVLPRSGWRWRLAIVLAALQWGWILKTAGSEAGYAASAVDYHQVPAFAAYFFGGCLIGYWRRVDPLRWPQRWGAICWLAMAALLLVLNPVNAGEELLGLRGAVLFCACFLTVLVSGQVQVRGVWSPIARWLGDITYGTYLLHPMLFFGLSWFVLPQFIAVEVVQLPLAARWALLATVMALSCLTATASERWFEAPVRRWGKRWLLRL